MKRLALTALAAGLVLALCDSGAQAQGRGGRSSGGGGRSSSGRGASYQGGGGNSTRSLSRPATVSRPSVQRTAPVTSRQAPRTTMDVRPISRPQVTQPRITRSDVRPTTRPQATGRPSPTTRPGVVNSALGTRPGVVFNTGSRTQPGRIVTSPSRWGNNYHVTNGRRSNFGYSYHGRHHRHWTHRCWSRHHRCWTYWDGGRRCYYYWCSPDACFYPVSHCPHNTYSWSNDGFCVTSCTAVDCLADDPTTVAVEEAAPAEQDVEYGMQILELLDGTAMDRGMKVGDIIVSLGGQATPDFDALRAALESAEGEADVDFINTDNGQLERVRLYPEETRIGVTVEPVALPEIAATGGTDESADSAPDIRI